MGSMTQSTKTPKRKSTAFKYGVNNFIAPILYLVAQDYFFSHFSYYLFSPKNCIRDVFKVQQVF